MSRLTYELGHKGSGSYEPIQNKDMPVNNYITCVNKLGKLEDIFELIEEMYKKPVYWKNEYGDVFCEDYTDSTILYNPKTNEIEIYKYEFIARYKIEEYGITWWLKEDKSE